MMRAAEISERVDWPAILAALGVPETFLRLKKAGPCLFCGGTDRWVFDNRHRRGDYFCRQCGPGDGFTLLMKFAGQDFATVRKRVLQAGGLADRGREAPVINRPMASSPDPEPSQPTRRVLELWRTSCAVADCPDARNYLDSRGLWPLPPRCALRAHPSAEFWDDGRRVGRYPILLAPIRDLDDHLASVHVTYLQHGQKLQGHESRKILSTLYGRTGAAVRLIPAGGDTLGIAEGLETAMSAAKIHQVPTWAALNTALLTKFEPPPETQRVVIYADNDAPGLLAAARLMERLQGRFRVDITVPAAGFKDFNDEVRHGKQQ